jgi:CubicO group peptidase (beta-lactamase class C family)
MKVKSMFKHAAAFLTIFLALAVPAMQAHAVDVKAPDEAKLKAILAEFEQYAVKGMADWQIPGMAVAIVRGDEILYEKTFGVKELGKKDPVTENTLFQIGSTSKAFTSALVATLVDEGKVKWSDLVVDHLGGFMMYDPWVTREFMVSDLMAQHSGLVAHAIDGTIMMGFDRQHTIDSLKYVKPATSFRSAFAYQNNMWLVAAELVEKETGKTWEENISQRIFKPLGMTASSCDMKSFITAPDAATLHRRMGDKIVILPMDWPHMYWVYNYGPAGGINSNIKDVEKWARMQAANGLFEGRQVIKEENVKIMHSPQTITETGLPRQYYCLGWVYREATPYPIVWHNGGTSGSKTMIALVPEAKISVIVLSNLIDNGLPETLAYKFIDMYFGNPARDWSKEDLEKTKETIKKAEAEEPKKPASPEPAMPLDKYTGDYSNDVYGTVTVSKKGDGLVLTIGPKKVEMDLSHWDRDTFMGKWDYYIEQEEAGFVMFRTGPDGAPVDMVVDAFNGDDCGIFRKAAPGDQGHS